MSKFSLAPTPKVRQERTLWVDNQARREDKSSLPQNFPRRPRKAVMPFVMALLSAQSWRRSLRGRAALGTGRAEPSVRIDKAAAITPSAGIAFLDQRCFFSALLEFTRRRFARRGGHALPIDVRQSRRERCSRRADQYCSNTVEAIMSTPTKNENRVDDPLSNPPRWMPQSPPVAPGPSSSAAAPPAMLEIANSPAMAAGIGGPNLDLPPPPRLRPFGRSAAATAEPGSWQPDQDLVPQPPIGTTGRKAAGRATRRSALVVILSAIVVLCAAALPTILDREWKQASDVVAMVTPLLEGSSRAGKPAQSARLVIESRKGFINEPLPLGISLNHASGGEMVTLAGLATGTTVSAGRRLGLSSWQVPARDIGNALAYAPKDFVGIMDVAIDLHSANDWLLDSRVVRLEWVPRQAAPLTSRLDRQ
jgi:hypothetical protein